MSMVLPLQCNINFVVCPACPACLQARGCFCRALRSLGKLGSGCIELAVQDSQAAGSGQKELGRVEQQGGPGPGSGEQPSTADLAADLAAELERVDVSIRQGGWCAACACMHATAQRLLLEPTERPAHLPPPATSQLVFASPPAPGLAAADVRLLGVLLPLSMLEFDVYCKPRRLPVKVRCPPACRWPGPHACSCAAGPVWWACKRVIVRICARVPPAACRPTSRPLSCCQQVPAACSCC